MANTIMDRIGAPPVTWLLCLMYVPYVLNHTWDDGIAGRPLSVLLGITVDTSVLLRYHFWQQVYFKTDEPGFTPQSLTTWIAYQLMMLDAQFALKEIIEKEKLHICPAVPCSSAAKPPEICPQILPICEEDDLSQLQVDSDIIVY
jgi:hypothetical protein